MPAYIHQVLDQQRTAFLREGTPDLATRRGHLQRLKRLLLDNQAIIAGAISTDFGHRPSQETRFADLFPTVAGIDYLHRHVAKWMRAERRGVAWYFRPGRARVLYQPLGVVGIISPWNYPIFLAFPPMAAALAAGNRVMLKPSEFTPATSALLAELLGQAFSVEQVAVVTGGSDVGAAFASLPFDHLFFTGSTPVGRKVMQAASEHLVPVTLELGGKSPAIVERGFPLDRAAGSIANGKLLNAGQTCVAPDYALVPAESVEPFIAAMTAAVRRLYPTIGGNPDFTSIVNEGHYQRLVRLVDDARSRGARIIELGTGSARDRIFAPVLIAAVSDDMKIMREEIFGPILPIVAYQHLDDAIEFVNARPRPLSLYLFGSAGTGRDAVLAGTTSGDVTINDTLMHIVQEELPFGGIGASGMGSYHGYDGFRTFSHAKGVFTQSRFNAISLMRPPYGKLFEQILRLLLR
jgi:coniferyl-aldehyde dehydrogenase